MFHQLTHLQSSFLTQASDMDNTKPVNQNTGNISNHISAEENLNYVNLLNIVLAVKEVWNRTTFCNHPAITSV